MASSNNNRLKDIYLNWLVVVYAVYCYFNKGIAYTYLAEFTWLLGILILLKDIRNYAFVWRKETILILFFLLMTMVYLILGIPQYGLVDTIRDSFVINYAFYVFIAFLFVNNQEVIAQKIANVYAFFPIMMTASFLLRTFFPDLNNFILVGNYPLLAYKNGDMAVHLFICLIFMLTGKVQTSPRLLQLNYFLVGYLLLISATYSRGGMLAFILPMAGYIFAIRKTVQGKRYLGYIKYAPIVLIIALPLYLATKVEDKAQGRKIGIEQLQENVTSIVAQDSRKVSKTLNDNVVWRLTWWTKIIDYTFAGPYFWQGKGLGVNLSVSDEVNVGDDSLRSPHNYSLTLLARYGVPFFVLWIIYLFLLWRPLFKPTGNPDLLIYSLILVSFFINASFDVTLEGPVTGMPFWLFTGLLLMKKAENDSLHASHHSINMA
jgi:hypothetical protein